MSLDHYEFAFRATAHDLAAWATARERQSARALLKRGGPAAIWADCTRADLEAVPAMLGLSKAPFQRKWRTIPEEDRPVLLLRLIQIALQSASATAQAQSIAAVTGLGYRQALRTVAATLLLHPAPISTSDLADVLR